MSTNAPVIPAIEQSPIADVTKTAVYLRLRFGRLGTSRKVSKDKVTVDADADVYHVGKTILESPELKAVVMLDREVVSYLKRRALPFEEGIRLLPVRAIGEVDAALRRYADRRKALVETFLGVYEERCREAQAKLRDLYNEADYPTVEDARRAFFMTWRMFEFDVPTKLRAVSMALYEEEKEKLAESMRDLGAELRMNARAGFLKLIETYRRGLETSEDGRKRGLQPGTAKKLTEFLAFFDVQDVTADKELREVVEMTRRLVDGVDVESLRDSDVAREAVAQGFGMIADVMVNSLGVAPIRRFRDDDEDEDDECASPAA